MSEKFHAAMMRPPAPPSKAYFAGEGVGAGGAVGDGVADPSIFRTRPAGVRSASIGVVSGVGGGAGVASAA